MTPMPRKRGPPTPLRIDTPTHSHSPHISLGMGDNSASTLSSATSESDVDPFSALPAPLLKPRSLRNMKKLSLNLPSAQSSAHSFHEPQSAVSVVHPDPLFQNDRKRCPSINSLPTTSRAASAATLLHRREEEGSPTVPYLDGPLQIIPGVWLGSEDNARDWKGLIERGIRSVLNVAKEVSAPLDGTASTQSLHSFVFTPGFKSSCDQDPTYCAPHPASGRPGMHYLKLQWSHGQQDLVKDGFKAAMAFTDTALERGEGVLVHCQCGISRSATLVIALVMRAAAERSPSVPPEVWALKGMQGAYTFVKSKSRWVGPNMSLIYQLLEYEKALKGDIGSPTTSERSSALADEEEEWGRRRRLLDETPSEAENYRESNAILQEAEALDKAMEDRVVARKNSASSVLTTGSGLGMGPAWRSRYNHRKRTGSIASNVTNSSSILSEDLVEEDEEQGVTINDQFEDDQPTNSSVELDESSATNSPEDEADKITHCSIPFTLSSKAGVRALPSAPVWKISFNLPPPPATATRPTFELPPIPRVTKSKRRPPPISLLPTVPPSPIALINGDMPAKEVPIKSASTATPTMATPKARSIPRHNVPPPLPLRSNMLRRTSTPQQQQHPVVVLPQTVLTPSQTLFVFPTSPTVPTARTLSRIPSTMMVYNANAGGLPPSTTTPRVSTFLRQGRTRSFIGVVAPMTPTTAFTKVEARGYMGLE